MTEQAPKKNVRRCILRYTLNRVPVAISRVAIRVADCRSMIAIHVTRMIFEQDFKKKNTREIIREIFLVRGQSSTVTEANTAESFTIFIYNENALNNIKSYQNFHKTMTIIFEKRKITLTVHGFKLDLILSPFFERSG